ncbi:hypothetical protein FA15DRAFT_672689 [Coprinopsis marcescibilis]|uniref:Uncharacterized protein n=1 Tax=Coprinopsis marcescibilis TaxID=230819 RepID=A0A5C3KM60_COPMA|nr:hypothetical protein FA15DRAFT_672689 [Coprinopsis marcescibilis]
MAVAFNKAGAFAVGLLFFHPWIVAGVPSSHNIDDQRGDSRIGGSRPIYLPLGRWEDQNCLECLDKPDARRTHDGTFTQTTYDRGGSLVSIDLAFEGTAIDVYFVLVNELLRGTVVTELNITLDSRENTSFTYTPDRPSATFEYDRNVFSSGQLPNGNHTLVISTGSFVIFDYATYTYDDDPLAGHSTTPGVPDNRTTPSFPDPSDAASTASSSQSTPVGAIVGGVVGGIAAICAVSLLVVFLLRRRKHRDRVVYEAGLRTEVDRASAGPPQPSFREQAVPTSEPHFGAYPIGGPYTVTDDSTLSGSAPAFMSGPPPSSSPKQERLRQERREELERQLGSIEQDIRALYGNGDNREARSRENIRAAQEDGGMTNRVEQMTEQIRTLQEQMLVLKQNLRSDWAQGLTDDPPPGYSPSSVARS